MASLLRRAQATQEKAEAREDQKAKVMVDPPDFDVWLGWRHLVSRAILVVDLAAMTQVVQEMGDLKMITYGCSKDLAHLWHKVHLWYTCTNASNLWYTCTECSSRWPRKLNETVLPPTTHPSRNQGRTSGSMNCTP